MPEKKESPPPGTDRPTRRRRNRLSSDQRGNRLSRPLAAALILILAGGAYLFWPRGGGAPIGIGEQLTIITADSVASGVPRSGSVDIEQEQQPLVAEQPDARTQAPTAAEPAPAKPPAVNQAQTSSPAPRPAPRPAPTPAPQPAPEPIQPRSTGGWAVQVGAFGAEINADQAANRLREQGIDAHVRTASTATGELIYRVWIGWFPSRDLALAYAKQERSRIGEAHPVHR